MSTPVKTFGDYVVCFDAEDEDRSARYHFVTECGWTEKEFNRIRHYPFFCAKVSIWKDGEEVAVDYLGACSYKTEKEFYTKCVGDYFADMVQECANQIKNPELVCAVSAWREKLREKRQLAIERMRVKQAAKV